MMILLFTNDKSGMISRSNTSGSVHGPASDDKKPVEAGGIF